MAVIEELSDGDLAVGPEVRAKLQEAKTAHGEAYVLTDSDDKISVVVRKPRRAEYQRFRQERADPGKRAAALERLFLSCLVWPTPTDFEPTLNSLPAIGDSFGAALFDRISGAVEAEVRKG